jgi:hypothetical protein
MRRILVTILVGCLALSVNLSNAAATIKAGATCPKLGKITTQNNIKYFCIKKNNKLVWNKGAKVTVKATQTPAPKSTSTASPTSTPTPNTLAALAKMNLDIYNRYLKADKKISPSFNYVRCPNVDPAMAAITENAYIDAYSFWATIYKSSAKINWLLMSEKDWTCWYDTTAIFEGPNSVSRSWKVWNKDTGVLGHCYVSSGAFCGYGTGVREGGIFAQYNMIGSNYKIAPSELTVHHETVHNYQAQLVADNYQTSKISTLACWFMEGQANLFGVPIATKGIPTSHRNFEISRLLKVYPKGASYTKEEWLGVLNNLKNSNGEFCFNNELGYSLGWFALEWTYMNYSIEEMHNFLEAIAKGSTWEEAIQSYMKMDEQTYYGKIAQYFADAF